MLLPWSRVKDWTCFACGECCKWFFVGLRPDEAVRIASTHGRDKIEVVHGKPILRRIGNSCVFLHGNLCLLGDEKPIACKLWPIIFMKEGNAESYFSGYHVYFDDRCPGVQKGRPSDRLYRIIMEAIHLKEGRIIKQTYTTAEIKSGLLPSTVVNFILVKKVPLLRDLSMSSSLSSVQSTHPSALHFIILS